MQTLIDQFLRTYQGRLKPSTFLDYRSILRRHLSQYSTFDELNQGLEEYLAGIPLSFKRKNNILSATRTFVGWARRREIWTGHFFKIPRFPGRSAKIKPLDPAEAKLLMTYAPFPYRDYFQFAILTGVRTGEALGLRFEDFDLKKRLISIRRALTCGKVVSTKTESSERTFAPVRPVWEIYQRRLQGNRKGSPWFFYSNRGGILSRGALQRYWRTFLAVFDIEARPLYATRHTYASLAIASGEDPLWVAKTLGHRRPDQLFLAYASYIEGVKKDGDKFLDLVIGKKTLMRVLL
jgi:integrase